MRDGRFANNAWLAECPHPVTKLVWDNAAMLSMATAKELGVWNDDLITIELRGQSVTLPVWIKPGQADNTISLPLGWGRKLGDQFKIAGGGFDVYPLRASTAVGVARGAKVSKAVGSTQLVSTQDHGAMEETPDRPRGESRRVQEEPGFRPGDVPARAGRRHPQQGARRARRWPRARRG